MKRKLIKQGERALTLTLPTKWVIKNNLKPGEEIDLLEKDDQLVITAKAMPCKLDAFELDLKGYDKYIVKIIAGLYRNGYDEINFQVENLNQIRTIQKVLAKYFPGYEVIAQGKTMCKISSIAMETSEEFHNIFRRAFRMVKMMAADVSEAIETNDLQLLEAAKMHEESNNRYVTICKRMIIKYKLPNPRKSCFHYLAIDQIEKIADQYKYLCDYLLSFKKMPKLNSEIKKYLIDTKEFVDAVYDVFYSYKFLKGKELFNTRKKIMKKLDAQANSVSKQELRVVHFMFNIVEQVGNVIGFRLEIEV